MVTSWTVVLCSLLTIAVGTDPLLLEYSDYYYDLYYGDYDDYSYRAELPATAPRSIRVEKPQSNINKKSSDSNDIKSKPQKGIRRGTRAKQTEPSSEPRQERESGRLTEPLNVRLQRMLSQDQSAAQTILDILEAPQQSQQEIVKFLRHIVKRIREEQERNAVIQDNREQTRPPPPPPTSSLGPGDSPAAAPAGTPPETCWARV